jgi:hypothetical protein
LRQSPISNRISPFLGSVANAKFLAHSEAANIARRAVNRGFEKEQFGTPLFGGPYLQHNPSRNPRCIIDGGKEAKTEILANTSEHGGILKS